MTRLADRRLLVPSLGRGLLITDEKLRPLVHLDAISGLPASVVICVTPTRDGVVWLGTEDGIARLNLSPGINRFTALNGLERRGANSMMRINDEPTFAPNIGPLRLREAPTHTANPIFDTAIPIDDKLNTFQPTLDGVRVGGLRSLWWVDPQNQITDLNNPSNIRSILLHSRFPDHVFALHLAGLAVWLRPSEGGSDAHLVPAPSGELQSLAIDPEGDLWIGGPNSGVWCLPYGSVPVPALDEALADPTPLHHDEQPGLPSWT